MRLKLILLAQVLVCLQPQSFATAAGPEFSRVIVFGDSLSDTGNLFILTEGAIPAPPYFNGRFSNGPVWIETFAPRLGLGSSTPYLLGGTCFAYGGAETGWGFSARGTPNIGMQIDEFVTAGYKKFAGSELIVLWAGANDYNAIPPASPSAPEQVVGQLAEQITQLAQLKGKYFLVPNLPPLGETPQARAAGPFAQLLMNLVALDHNVRLDEMLDDLEQRLGITVLRFGTHGLVSRAIRCPGEFGFSNVTEQGMLADDPDTYLFWDLEHPTRVAHAMLGQVGAAVVLTECLTLALDVNADEPVRISGPRALWTRETLVLRLRLAQSYLDNGRLVDAIAQLRQFGVEVEWLASSGRMNRKDASSLIADALAAIGCLQEVLP